MRYKIDTRIATFIALLTLSSVILFVLLDLLSNKEIEKLRFELKSVHLRFKAEILLVMMSPFLGIIIEMIIRGKFGARKLSTKDHIVAVSMLVFAPMVIYSMYFHNINDTRGTVIVLSVVFASIGWLYTNYVSITSRKKNNTVNLVAEIFKNSDINECEDVLRLVFLNQKTGNAEFGSENINLKIKSDDGEKIRKYIIRYLNFYEFMAVSILHREVDEPFIKDTIAPKLIRAAALAKCYLEYRENYTNKNSSASTYKNLMSVANSYEQEAAAGFK